jgi:uncharacterized membrane protein YgdD (TMEM256/DUF423 family)
MFEPSPGCREGGTVHNSGMSSRDEAAERTFVVLAGVLGALAVGLGAYGAHGLERALEGAPDAAKRVGWWETAVLYHLAHALALGLAAWLAGCGRRLARVAGILLVAGVLLFAGTLYAMALGAPRWLGAVTPIGGLSLMVGWALLAVAGAHRSREGV